MKSAHEYRNNLRVLSRPYKIIHKYNKRNQLLGTYVVLLGENGIYHLGVALPAPGEPAIKKMGKSIALNRARLEYAIVNGLTFRTGRLSRSLGCMGTTNAEELRTELGFTLDQLPFELKDRPVAYLARELGEQVAHLHTKKEELQKEIEALEKRREGFANARTVVTIPRATSEDNVFDEKTIEMNTGFSKTLEDPVVTIDAPSEVFASSLDQKSDRA